MVMIRTILAGVALASGLAAGAAAAQTTPPPPACSGDAYKSLDFWTGEWTAILPAGATLPSGAVASADVVAAAASVEPILDGCVYLEHWDTVPFGAGQINRGKGFHRFDAASGKWRQIWVDNSGAEYISIGEPFEGGVRYSSESAAGLSRQTIVPVKDGAVRNFGESSTDGGDTWAISFDFYYRRK